MKVNNKLVIGLGLSCLLFGYGILRFLNKNKRDLELKATRYTAKKIINDKLGGNEKLLTLVDELSEKDLEFISEVIREIKSSRK
ncbi:hypothetical protein [Lactiplantibacillus plantarum]|uniref:hypothetical protein n=1 Tax=Lactiplantibacillus plantarum TaxID=1590 RepID=UPI001BA7896A|nr:hypothetical protein [Lactiplantibacillus plantarum]MBS0945924.1 hypothetical protein [Lactiplantibacillus plantarum]